MEEIIRNYQKKAVQHMRNAQSFNELFIWSDYYIEFLHKNKAYFPNYIELMKEENELFHSKAEELRKEDENRM